MVDFPRKLRHDLMIVPVALAECNRDIRGGNKFGIADLESNVQSK